MGVRIKTGFEGATLKELFRAWLWSKDIVEVMRAAVELRRRLSQFESLSEDPDDSHDASN